MAESFMGAEILVGGANPPGRAEVLPAPIPPSDFTSDTADIYTNTLCYGAGNAGNPQLCNYCFLSPAQLKDRTMMDMATFEEIIGWLTSPDSPVRTISLLGGEFPLNPHAKDMMRYAYDANLSLHIVTNGSPEFRDLLKDDEVGAMLQDSQRDNLVAVSLDSVYKTSNDRHRGRGALENALSAIDALRRCKWGSIRYRINATLTKTTMAEFEDLCAFAELAGAQSVLVHFPSSVGMGTPLYNPAKSVYEQTALPSAPEWRSVLKQVQKYNRRSGKRPDFKVAAELGYLGLNFPGEDAHRCDMLARASSLQFTPRIGPENADVPVVSCGLNMDEASTRSAYILRDGQLWQRAGQSEIDVVPIVGCPATKVASSRWLGCIYMRLTVDA